jgi:hypothetical protein
MLKTDEFWEFIFFSKFAVKKLPVAIIVMCDSQDWFTPLKDRGAAEDAEVLRICERPVHSLHLAVSIR